LGQTQDACVTLGQVGVRFPQAPEAVEAGVAMQKLSCQ
jgi:TolA-binding protein